MTVSFPEVRFELLFSAKPHHDEYRKADLEALVPFVLGRERVQGPVELTLDLTHPQRIQSLNRRFRGVDRNTDVIAFRYEVGPQKGMRGAFAGDIAINVAQARIQAKKMRHSTRREIRLLLIHGLLHLLGYTDYEPRPRRRMFKRQNELLRQWEKRAP